MRGGAFSGSGIVFKGMSDRYEKFGDLGAWLLGGVQFSRSSSV